MSKFDKIAYNDSYNRANYKQLKITIRPEQRDHIYAVADKYGLSNAQLIIAAVNEYDLNHSDSNNDSR